MGQHCGPYSDFVGADYFEEVACGSGRLVDLAQGSVCVCVCVCVCAVLNIWGLPSQLLFNRLL